MLARTRVLLFAVFPALSRIEEPTAADDGRFKLCLDFRWISIDGGDTEAIQTVDRTWHVGAKEDG